MRSGCANRMSVCVAHTHASAEAKKRPGVAARARIDEIID